VNSCEPGVDVERWAQAVDWFLRVRSDAAREEDLLEFEGWTNADGRNVLAYQQVVASWDAVGRYESEPQIVSGRREALADSQRATLQRVPRQAETTTLARLPLVHRYPRWSIAAGVAAVIAIGAWWMVSPVGSVYATDRGEQRTVRLPDGSVVALDAYSRVRIRYRTHERDIALEHGQARFSVAKDPLRPFRVHARGKTVVALGTQFDVDVVSHAVHVTLLEGHVAISGVPAGPDPTNVDQRGPADARVVELTPGEALKVCDNGDTVLTAHVDVSRVMAWQSGQIFFDNEPLWSAVDRIGRYAKQRLDVDPSVAQIAVSGMFKTSDPTAFIEAITHYFPVDAVQVSDSRIILTRRKSEGPDSAQ
jgi:transmembrane sensor